MDIVVAGNGQPPIVWGVSSRGRLSQFALVALGAFLLTLSAKTQVPAWPVPMTMQTYVVLVIGMAYGTRLAVATVLAYLVAGALGLPVFAGTPEKGIGIAYCSGRPADICSASSPPPGSAVGLPRAGGIAASRGASLQ